MADLKAFYQRFYLEFVEKLPLDDAIFNANLYAQQLFSGDIKDKISSENTRANKNTLFLDQCIEKGFFTDEKGNISNPMLEKLLAVMESSNSQILQTLASRFRQSM